MINHASIEELPGIPLVVCINDCAIDHGQAHSELAPMCFRLGCAFAEMRWRKSIETSGEMAMIIRQQIQQSRLTKLYR
ncbi:MAG TPA: hypothetical protein VLR90_04010 [Blastocatellia bacterium]|nr:hypothetical protein [Blastocatellia bacterium]